MFPTGEPIRAPELSELETFVLALDEGSIARAAGRLRISSQAAAKRIRQLEVLAHAPLLVRGRRGVSATEIGARLYPIACESISQRDRIVEALAGAPAPDPLRIAGMRQLLGRAPAPRTEAEFKTTEAVLAAIFHGTSEAVALTRVEDGLIREVNDAAVRLLGYQQRDLRGRLAPEVQVWDDIGLRDECVRRAVSSREPQHAELVVRARGGHRLLVAARFEAVELGGSTHVLVTLRELRRLDSVATPVARRRADELVEEQLAASFFEALCRGVPTQAEAAAEAALDQGFGVAAVHTQLIEPAMRSIGELWERGKISVSEEHLATAISHEVAARIFPRGLSAMPGARERVMMTAIQGEQHVLGLRLAADVLECAGYDVLYLGADVPLDALLAACRIHQPDVLGFTVSTWPNVPTMILAIHEIMQLEQPPRIMVGGRAAVQAITHGLNAPIVEHADQILEVVRQLLAGPPPEHVISAELAARVPLRDQAAPVGTEQLAAIDAAFSATASFARAGDVRESPRAAAPMERLAHQDDLTGLHNRRAFDDRLQAIAQHGPHSTLLMIGIDTPGSINDTGGRHVGDETLVGVGRVILESIRSGEFAARIGGEEFVALLSAVTGSAADAVAERIRAAVAAASISPAATVSIGIAEVTSDARQARESADRALSLARESGGNRTARPEH